MVGVEGLALLRLLYADDAVARRAERLAEVGRLLAGESPDSTGSLGAEFGLEDGYRQWAETYDRPLRLFALEEPPMRRILDPLEPGTVLDAACGTGRYATYLAARGHEVIGVDQSPAMLDRARAKLPAATFVEGDLTNIPLDDGTVDTVVCALALVHVGDLDAAMRELTRVVRPGGRIAISDVHPFIVMLGWQAQFPVAGGRGFMRLHPHLPSEYVGAAARRGFVVRSCEEPLLTEEAAATPTAGILPEANSAAYVGLPGVLVWELAQA